FDFPSPISSIVKRVCYFDHSLSFSSILIWYFVLFTLCSSVIKMGEMIITGFQSRCYRMKEWLRAWRFRD
ncbi:hypothetical protein GIB67_000038, partial [Kingdonia uniflora]